MCENDFWLRHVFHDCSHNADVYLFCRLLERAATLIQVKSFDHKERSSEIMRHRTKLLLLPPRWRPARIAANIAKLPEQFGTLSAVSLECCYSWEQSCMSEVAFASVNNLQPPL
jgi:hypothetical protein